MKIERKKSNPVWTRDDWGLAKGFTTSAVLCWPNLPESNLKVLKELARGNSVEVVEIVLKGFEKEARGIYEKAVIEYARLQKVRPDSFRASLVEITKFEKNESEIRARLDGTKRVFERAEGVRRAIKRKATEEAALEMMILVFAAVTVNLHGIINKGIRAKTAPAKGGRGDKKFYGIISAIEQTLKNNNAGNAHTIWRYFKKNHRGEDNPIEIDDYEIYFYEDMTGKEENLLFQKHINGKERSMKYSTFERHVNSIKKKLH